MKSRFTGVLTFFLAFMIQFSFAQQEKTITGTVTSAEDNLPLVGATVRVEGTTRGTQTDLDGKFFITASSGEKLTISYVSMAAQTITVGASNVINVKLNVDNIIGGVSIEGYRTTSKPRSNVAAVTVSNKTIEGRPNANFMQTLQGQVPGLNISTGSGQPGSGSTVILRGYGSIKGNVEPLYVIDGIPLTVDNFRSLNPHDIESVSVLKDAGATAVYGNRGANGVIIITTKKGDYGTDLKIGYSSMFGFNYLQDNNYRVMDSRQILTMEKSLGQGFGNTLTDAEIANYPINTDWKDVLFRTGTTQNHVLSLSSGGKNTNSYTSLGYYNIEGILNNTALTRFNFRNNLSGKSSDGKFNYATSLTANFSKNNEIWGAGSSNVNLNPILGAMQGLPYVSPSWYQSGQQLLDMYQGANNPYGVGVGNLALTPLMLMDQFNSFVYDTNEIKSIANFQGSYKITDDLTFGSSFGLDFTETQFLLHRSSSNFTELLFRQAGEDYLGYQTENSIREVLFNTLNRLNYSKTFAEKHTIDVGVFLEYFKAHRKGMQYTQNGLDPKLTHPGAGTGFIPHNPTSNPHLYVPEVSAAKSSAGMFSYFATADYDYSDKYGVGASIRRDASFRFSNSNRWGTFWSVSGRWNIDREKFMEDSGFQMLKLRASYGTSGNQNIQGQSVFNAANRTRTLYGLMGIGYALNPSYTMAQLGNDDLMWETIAQTNIGLDFAVLGQRLRGSVDVYKKNTIDMYIDNPLSAVTGFGLIDANVGEMENRGIEAIVFYDVFPSESEFKLTLSANGSFNKNKIIDIKNDDGVDYTYNIDANGHPFREYYLVRYAGVNPANGNALFYTADGQLTETPDEDGDRVFTGKTFYPVYQGGFGFNANYKNFFLTTQFNFVYDLWRFDDDYAGLMSTAQSGEFGQFNKSTDLTRAWTPDNRYTDVPALGYNTGSYDVHDRFLKDASYLRLRYISIGYDFSKEALKGTFFDSARVYVQGENLYTWSKWRGWDAESNRVGDNAQYPTPRSVSVGLDVQF